MSSSPDSSRLSTPPASSSSRLSTRATSRCVPAASPTVFCAVLTTRAQRGLGFVLVFRSAHFPSTRALVLTSSCGVFSLTQEATLKDVDMIRQQIQAIKGGDEVSHVCPRVYIERITSLLLGHPHGRRRDQDGSGTRSSFLYPQRLLAHTCVSRPRSGKCPANGYGSSRTSGACRFMRHPRSAAGTSTRCSTSSSRTCASDTPRAPARRSGSVATSAS